MFVHPAYTCVWHRCTNTPHTPSLQKLTVMLHPASCTELALLLQQHMKAWKVTVGVKLYIFHFTLKNYTFFKILGMCFKNFQSSIKKNDWTSLSGSAIMVCVAGPFLTMSFQKTFRMKPLLAKKQKKNCPISPQIWIKTGNKIKYNSKEDIGEETGGSRRNSTCDRSHFHAVPRLPASYHIKLKMSPPSGQLDMFYWENNDFFLCF